MCFAIEKIFEDYAISDMTAASDIEWVEETTHHPVTAAMIAADMVANGTDIIDASIQMYSDGWYGYSDFGVRFCHFYQMVCYLVK